MNDISYSISIEKNNLILIYKNENNMKKFVSKNSVDIKSKKTQRLAYAIKKLHNLSLKILSNSDEEHKITLIVTHPLYDNDEYIMYEDGYDISDDDMSENITKHNNKKPLFYLYILELEQDKFYVGKSLKPLNRTGEHLASTLLNDTSCAGAGWTRMYPPNKILDVIISYDEFDEDMTTLRYMKKYGIDNVRGGSFCELNLNRDAVTVLEKMLAGSEDKCYFCGSVEHYINSCPQKNTKRKTKKYTQKKIKAKDIPKSRIAKYYGATKLLQNSNIDIKNITKDESKEYKCKFCNKIMNSREKKAYHENLVCEKNVRVELNKKNESNIDAILRENEHFLNKDGKSTKH